MKKKYIKPHIIIENFSLSETIAAGCEFQSNNPTQGVCGYPTRNGMVFTTEIMGCEYHQPDNNDALCYHVPTDTTNIFNS